VLLQFLGLRPSLARQGYSSLGSFLQFLGFFCISLLLLLPLLCSFALLLSLQALSLFTIRPKSRLNLLLEIHSTLISVLMSQVQFLLLFSQPCCPQFLLSLSCKKHSLPILSLSLQAQLMLRLNFCFALLFGLQFFESFYLFALPLLADSVSRFGKNIILRVEVTEVHSHPCTCGLRSRLRGTG